MLEDGGLPRQVAAQPQEDGAVAFWALSMRVARLEERLAAEIELRRARREDDLASRELAAADIDRRLTGMNEFRDQLTKQAQNFATKEMVERVGDQGSRRLARVETWQAKIIGALLLLSLAVPAVTALIVYAVTKHH